MIDLIFASHNRHKSEEIRNMLGNIVHITNLSEIGLYDEIPETGNTFEENALQKAQYVHDRCRRNCFADDSGLMVDALDGAPGVRSARYAGEPVNMENNIALLLKQLDGVKNRSAKFVTVIAAIIDNNTYYFHGEVKGQIIADRRGTGGFGYDPIFIPDGYDKTFAELGAETKNDISHRANAIKALKVFLEQNQIPSEQ